jgi:hypothetical protein
MPPEKAIVYDGRPTQMKILHPTRHSSHSRNGFKEASSLPSLSELREQAQDEYLVSLSIPTKEERRLFLGFHNWVLTDVHARFTDCMVENQTFNLAVGP